MDGGGGGGGGSSSSSSSSSISASILPPVYVYAYMSRKFFFSKCQMKKTLGNFKKETNHPIKG
jgi:hypothetical protein